MNAHKSPQPTSVSPALVGTPSTQSGRDPAFAASPTSADGSGPSGLQSGVEDFNTVWADRPAKPTCDKVVEVDVVGRRCVYLNNYRIAGGKPYVSEGLPSHTLTCTLGDVLNAFTDAEIRKGLREQRAEREYFKAYHERKALTAPNGNAP